MHIVKDPTRTCPIGYLQRTGDWGADELIRIHRRIRCVGRCFLHFIAQGLYGHRALD